MAIEIDRPLGSITGTYRAHGGVSGAVLTPERPQTLPAGAGAVPPRSTATGAGFGGHGGGGSGIGLFEVGGPPRKPPISDRPILEESDSRGRNWRLVIVAVLLLGALAFAYSQLTKDSAVQQSAQRGSR